MAWQRWAVSSVLILTAAVAAANDDVLVADFEADTYGSWQTTGDAFGPGPARGTLPGQMPVSGFQGDRLVNSFYQGDRSTGTLTSPPFVVERDYLVFLIGGGGHDGQTCLNLLLDGQVVRTATGANVSPGGSEMLELSFWNVAELRGKSVVLQIVDQATGGWGHINVDQIVQSNTKPNVPELAAHVREFVVQNKYLVLPIKNGVKKTEVVLEVAGQPVRRYSTELALDENAVDWYAFLTIESYRGQPARLAVDRATEAGFNLIRQADRVPGDEQCYTEPLRPQFHFSQQVGWNNDPNGMAFLNGQWHLFFQHNPVGWNWGNMTWGHAVSPDLVHWRQLPDALFPKTTAVGDCFSGGGVVDLLNTGGWKQGDQDVLVLFLTDTGAGESLAYSQDGGQTFHWYKGNPVVKHRGRDPKVIWYRYDGNDQPLNDRARALGGHWVMAVYDEHEQHGQNIAFYTSVDLRNWTEQSHLPGFYECPEIFPLPVAGQSSQRRWVVFAADARYVVGDFDGRSFRPAHPGKHQVHWGAYYASQTFSNVPDDRRIQIGWARIPMPGMPFNQTFSFPHELTLRSTPAGVRLFAEPVREIERLHRKQHVAPPGPLTPGAPVQLRPAGELFDIRATFELGPTGQVGLEIGGQVIAYDVARGQLGEAEVVPIDGRISLQVLVDRSILETCVNRGAAYLTTARERPAPDAPPTIIKAFADTPGARLTELQVHEVKSIWRP